MIRYRPVTEAERLKVQSETWNYLPEDYGSYINVGCWQIWFGKWFDLIKFASAAESKQ